MENHLLDVIDREDRVIGQVPKSEKLRKRFISRNVAVFVRDSSGRYIICRRAAHKEVLPNLFDTAACGNVIAGEAYEEAAQRELAEELGITCELSFVKKYYHEINQDGRVLPFMTALFIGQSDQEPVLNDELSEYKKVTVEELKKLIEQNPEEFCPPFIKDIMQASHVL